MKTMVALLLLFTVVTGFAQPALPDFLLGTWKMENKEVYEHWDKLNENTLKGFSYTMQGGQMQVTEYLDIRKEKKNILYSATVLSQNSGNAVVFTATKSDSSYVFENPSHDFPKKIVYRRLSDHEIFVQVSDGKAKGFAYKMTKQFHTKKIIDSTITNPNYDPALAEKLGADDYGMKSFFFVLLKTGPNTTTDKEFIAESFRGHMNNINRLVDEGKLIVAGPFAKNENNYRGIFIFQNIKTLEDARQIIETDLAIKNGLLDYDLFTWYGSAALPEYLPFSDKIFKIKP